MALRLHLPILPVDVSLRRCESVLSWAVRSVKDRSGRLFDAGAGGGRVHRGSFDNWCGLKIPRGVMIPVISSGGVTSKPGLRAVLVGFAIRT